MSSYFASQNILQFIIIKWLSYRQRQTGSFLRLNAYTHSPTNMELQRDLKTRNKKEETELNLT